MPAEIMAERAKLSPEARTVLDNKAAEIFMDPADPTPENFKALREFMDDAAKKGGGDLDRGLRDMAPPDEGETKPPAEPPRTVKMQAADVRATEPRTIKNGQEIYWELVDLKSGARFSRVWVDMADPANPGPPNQWLEPKLAKMPNGEVVQLTGEPKFSFTDESLKVNKEAWEKHFGKPLLEYGGTMEAENLANFQWEFARIRTANPGLSAQEVGNLAVREVSFGAGRIRGGFGDLTVQMGDFDAVTIAKGKYARQTLQDVPKSVSVSAKPTPRPAGEP
jgi:hypothetical protein